MQLLIKRAKIFMLDNKRFVAGPSGLPVPVPSWVAETGTYKNGIADKSIINLTERAREQEAVVAAEEGRAPDPIVEEEVPEQESTAQPTRLPNVKGQIRSSTKKQE